MKFVSWNVNGLRACIQKGFLEEFQKLNADFFCLQETKLSEGQLQLDLPGYEQYWCYAEKKGYSGTAIFTKHTPLSVTYGIGVPELDNEGRVITLEYKEFYLVTCYTPNAQRGLTRIGHRMTWDEAFRGYLKKLDAVKPVILCGDLNVAHKEIDLKNPGSNRNNAGFSDQERESFQKTLDLGFTDTFRHLYPDATGRYSWWSYMFHARENNAGWRIDYFLVSDRIKEQIYRADIHSDILGSDHCPVSLELDILVNGSLWSPDYIPPAPPPVEPEPEKKPKTSPITGKVFASIIPLLLFLTVSILAIGWLFGDDIDEMPTVDDSNLFFEIEVYYTPLLFDRANIDADEIVYGTGHVMSSILTDGTSEFYVGSYDGLEEADVFLRITGGGENMSWDSDEWTVSIGYNNTNIGNLTLTDHIEFHDLTIQPYYSDETMTDCQGWLVWGHTGMQSVADAPLTVNHAQDGTIYEETITLAPYLYARTVVEMQTSKLLLYLSSHPDIHGTMTAPLTTPNVISSYLDSYETRLLRLRQKYPAMDIFFAMSDAIDVLMHSSFTADPEFNRILLSVSRSMMTPEQEYMYITCQYPHAEYTITSDNIDYNVSAFTTEDLLNRAFDGVHAQWLASCSSAEVRLLVYDYIVSYDQFLQEFENRDDCIEVLMSTEIFKGIYIYGNDSVVDISLIPYYLLSMSYYRWKMTPMQEALFATNNYSNYPADIVIVDQWDDYSKWSTEDLIDQTLSYTTGVMLQKCRTKEAMYYVCLFRSRLDNSLAALLEREDLFSVLERKASQDQGDLPYALLYDALSYKPENSYTALSAYEIVRKLADDPTILYNVEQLVRVMGISYGEACSYYPILQELISRDDAFMRLGSIVVTDKDTDERLVTLLKQLPYMQDLSGVSASDLILRLDYVDGLKEQLLAAVDAQASFEELCAIHPFVQELLHREHVSAELIRHELRVQADYTKIFNYFLLLPEIQEYRAEPDQMELP